MIVYRICQTYPPAHNPIDGKGSFLFGGRWNPKGIAAVYTASSLALARCELARRFSLDLVPDNYRVYEIEVPDAKIIEAKPLPEDWDSDDDWTFAQSLGQEYLSNPSTLAFSVPSVCDKHTFNVILNPGALSYSEVRVSTSYPFEP